MNQVERISAALGRLRQEAANCRDPHQRRRLQSIEQAIRKALIGAGDDEKGGEG